MPVCRRYSRQRATKIRGMKMRSLMKKGTCLILAVLILILASACGKAEPDPNSGLYVGKTAEMSGITVNLADVFEEEFSIELKDGGKASFNYEGKSYSMKWTLDGTAFQASGGGAELSGTLADGVMELENVLDSGLSIRLER